MVAHAFLRPLLESGRAESALSRHPASDPTQPF